MNPWGTLNDWQRFEVEERVARYGRTRRPARQNRSAAPALRTRADTCPAPVALSQNDVATCA